MQNQIIKEEFVVNWKRTFLAPLAKWWIIFICAVLGAVGGFVGGKLTEKPLYQAKLTYMINFAGGNYSSTTDLITTSILSTNLNNCIIAARQNAYFEVVMNDVNSNRGITDENDPNYLPRKYLESVVTFQKSAGSGTALDVYVTTDDAEKSFRILQAVERTFEKHMNSKFETNDGTTMSFKPLGFAEQPQDAISKMSKMQLAAIGGVVLAVVSYLLLCIIEMLDIKIKDVEDLKYKYNAPILGKVYDFVDVENKNKEEEYAYANKEE